jgi:alanine dehydrogenase
MTIGVPKEIKNNENRVALTNATLPYALQLANKGWIKACADNMELRHGLNIIQGRIVCSRVAEAFDLPIYNADEFVLG